MAVRTSPAGGQALPGWVRAREGTEPGTVHLTVVEPRAVTAETAVHCCAQLRDRGYRRAVTNALGPADAEALLAAGFVVREALDLLGRDLADLGDLADLAASRPGRPPGGSPTRRTRRLDTVADLDRAAFGDRALDRTALEDALDATPRARLRIHGTPAHPLAYAITGVAGPRAYVQRLAVHPDARRRGLGRGLLADGLTWARRRGAHTAVVNTHVDNAAARHLYESVGFVVLPRGLVVLERAL